AFKRSSAARITAVLPYYGYARQDRKDKPRVPISAKLVADLLTAAGADRLLAIDLHAPSIQGFFDIPFDHLFAAPILIEHLKSMKLTDAVIVAPDAGGVERARAYAKRLHGELAVIVTTNTIPIDPEKQKAARIHCLSVAPLLGEAIQRIHNNSSVSSLFV